jgi:outer membrane lipoprotein-sorting protein
MTFSRMSRFQNFVASSKIILCILFSIVLASCAIGTPQPDQWDIVAEKSLARAKQNNASLKRLKCIAKISLAHPGQPVRRFRAAIAGQLDDYLRIDMFAPFGGSAGTFSADGKHLFLVTHPSRDYYKKRFGKGSLHRFVQLDVTVSELLELLVGRIPANDFFSLRFIAGEGGKDDRLLLLDRWGNTEQRIFFDSNGRAHRGEWLDKEGNVTHSMALIGDRRINTFELPRQIELSNGQGGSATIILEKYDTNAVIDANIFTIHPPSS